MQSATKISEWGLATYATRVEQWECDFNGHWNTRFYGTAFDQAAAVADVVSEQVQSGEVALNWHMRFHRELSAAASVRINSSKMQDGSQVHCLLGASGLAASALRWPCSAEALPATREDHLTQVNPRGLIGDSDWSRLERAERTEAIPLGIIAGAELDPSGRLRLEAMLSYCGRGSHLHREDISLGPDLVSKAGIGIMLVEMRASLASGLRLGEPMRMVSRIGTAHGKSFTSAHLLENYNGLIAARIEMCLLAVDLASRKAIEVPAMLRDLATEA